MIQLALPAAARQEGPATARERARAEATRLFAEAARLWSTGERGDSRLAAERAREAAAHWRAAGDGAAEAEALLSAGILLAGLGEHQSAIPELRAAIARYQALGDRASESVALREIGGSYYALGNTRRALAAFEPALALARAAGDRPLESMLLTDAGHAYDTLGDFQRALDHYTASLAIKRTLPDPIAAGEPIVLNNIGHAYQGLGERARALEAYERSLAMRREAGIETGVGQTLANIGLVHLEAGEAERALPLFEQALETARRTADPDLEAAALYRRARAELALDRLTLGLASVEAALAVVEAERSRLTGHEFRALYFATKQQYYELAISIHMRLDAREPGRGHDRAALAVRQRARARGLLDTLGDAGVDVETATPLVRERRERLASATSAHMRALGDPGARDRVAAAAREREAAAAEYEEAVAEARRRSPLAADIRYPAPLALDEIQTSLLDDRTVLVEFALGEEASYVWAVTRTSVASAALPPRAEVEAAARRYLELLSARGCRPRHETEGERRERIAAADRRVGEAAAALARVTLAPIADRLDRPRLVVVSDGALDYVPFAALPAAGVPAGGVPAAGSTRAAQPLLLTHEVVSIPSASAVALMRRQAAARPAPERTLLVVADPVFDASDARVPRVGAPTDGAVAAAPGPEPSASDEALGATRAACGSIARFERLPGTRTEARALLALVPAGERDEALGFRASVDALDSLRLRDYRILHLATHAFVPDEHPELAGLVLSRVDERGRPRDGFLSLAGLSGLELSADLVTLSACETALGAEVRGEGLSSLARALMQAGARRVVASFWRVDDEATAALMGHFYRAMLDEKLAPAAALRRAQTALLKTPRFREPYYWAAFALYGDWR